jgi:hypothetical protein
LFYSLIYINFFKNFAYKMSDQYFIQLNRNIMELYDRGHQMTQNELAGMLNSIVTNSSRMVERRRQALNLPPPPPAVPMVNTAIGPVPLPPGGMVNVTTGSVLTREDLELRRRTHPNMGRTPAQLRPAAARPPRLVLSIKSKVLPRAVFAANCGEACAICMDTHQKGESLTTSCAHDFGKECYKNWFNSDNSNKSCPTCRTLNPQVTVYSKRVYRATLPQNNVVNVVENNVV